MICPDVLRKKVEPREKIIKAKYLEYNILDTSSFIFLEYVNNILLTKILIS